MSGSQIGGIIGGAVGGVIGFYTGNPVLGAQIGFSIGSGIGAYVDPVRVRGPRLEDARTQISTVGGAITRGYGKFTTAGNVIWTDRLIEHVKRERQGKGGGAKTTTYTYTRSYAIGFCQGPLYGLIWIKRNGKKVYTTDPAATQEERQYSAEFAKKLTVYLGTEEQMPDSTIVAVEGAGNVAPFRGLAYIVVENDDLTDLQGAIPQYEFCVNATAPNLYLTTPPYPVAVVEQIGSAGIPPVIDEYMGLIDHVTPAGYFDSASMPVVVGYRTYTAPATDALAPDAYFDSASLPVVAGYRSYSVPPTDALSPGGYFDSASLPAAAGYLTHNYGPPENISCGAYFDSGTLQ